jgi:hypothetical protein
LFKTSLQGDVESLLQEILSIFWPFFLFSSGLTKIQSRYFIENRSQESDLGDKGQMKLVIKHISQMNPLDGQYLV